MLLAFKSICPLKIPKTNCPVRLGIYGWLGWSSVRQAAPAGPRSSPSRCSNGKCRCGFAQNGVLYTYPSISQILREKVFVRRNGISDFSPFVSAIHRRIVDSAPRTHSPVAFFLITRARRAPASRVSRCPRGGGAAPPPPRAPPPSPPPEHLPRSPRGRSPEATRGSHRRSPLGVES